MSSRDSLPSEGFVPIPIPIMDAICHTQFSGYERRVLDFILRKTYGWNKQTDRISLSQFVNGTDLDKASIVHALNRLARRNIIIRHSIGKIAKGTAAEYGLNSEYGTWRSLVKSPTLVKSPIQPLVKSPPTTERSTTTDKGPSFNGSKKTDQPQLIKPGRLTHAQLAAMSPGNRGSCAEAWEGIKITPDGRVIKTYDPDKDTDHEQ